jgi:hypothetical protein
MRQPAIRISENEILLLSSLVSVSFNRTGDKAMLLLELCNHKGLTFTDETAVALYEKLLPQLDLGE